MKHRSVSVPPRLLLLVALAVAMLVGLATGAEATPLEPTLTLAQVQTKLASGPIPGYFKTVVSGSTVETFSVNVLAVTGGPETSSALIMFETTDSQVLSYGGIVSGMSGSPIYVDDGGTDKIIGAISYGDAFTLKGTGLATPVQFMLDMAATYPQAVTLDHPVLTSSGVVNKLVVTSDPARFQALVGEGTMIAQPMSPMFIGGLRPTDKAYRKLASHLAKRGADVAPLGGAGLGMTASIDESFTSGSAVAILAARGDLWYGGVGTVTYVNGNNVLAFGHPAFWEGDTDMYMANAWVDGVWPSSLFPYKVSRPGTVRGAFTQDRSVGILGDEAKMPAETTITARATSPDGSVATASSTVWASRRFVSSPYGDPYIAVFGAYPAGARIYDSFYEPGSADVTTTVVVRSGATTHTVSIANLADTDWDISYSVLEDAYRAVSEILSVYSYGLETPEIMSIDVESKMTKARHNGQIADVELTAPLKYGDNTVRVSVLKYGQVATQTIDVTLTVPYDAMNPVPLTGTLSASGAGFSTDFVDEGEPAPDQTTVVARKSVAQIVDELNQSARADDLVVKFEPEDLWNTEGEPVVYDSVSATKTTGIVVYGSAQRVAPGVSFAGYPSTIGYNGYTYLVGDIVGATSGTVDIYGTPVGETERLLAEDVPVETFDGITGFETEIGPLKKTTNLRAVYSGGKGATVAEDKAKISVKALVSLASSASGVRKGYAVTLTAAVVPTSTAGTYVQFQRYYGGRWVPITGSATTSTKKLALSGTAAKAVISYRVYATTKFRVLYKGGATNAANYSVVRTVYAY